MNTTMLYMFYDRSNWGLCVKLGGSLDFYVNCNGIYITHVQRYGKKTMLSCWWFGILAANWGFLCVFLTTCDSFCPDWVPVECVMTVLVCCLYQCYMSFMCYENS